MKEEGSAGSGARAGGKGGMAQAPVSRGAGLLPARPPAVAAARRYRLGARTSATPCGCLTAMRREDRSIPGARPGRPEWRVRDAPHRRSRRPFRNLETLSTSSPPLEQPERVYNPI